MDAGGTSRPRAINNYQMSQCFIVLLMVNSL